MRRFGLAVALVLALGAAACSDGGGNAAASGKGKEYADAFAATMLEDSDGVITEKEAQCTGESLVNTVGVKQLEESATPAEIRDGGDPFEAMEINEGAANKLYDSMNKCIDFRDMLIEQMAADEDMSDAAAKCLDENLSKDAVKAMMVTAMQGQDMESDPELAGKFMGPLMGCFMM